MAAIGDNCLVCMKHRILFILHLPPPVHGAAMVGKYIQDSSVINDAFDCNYVNLALAKNLDDIGKGGVRKMWAFMRQLARIRRTVRQTKPDLCYVTPNAKGGAFYKDFIVVWLLKMMRQRVVIHYHNKGVSSRQDKPVDNFLYKKFFKDLKVILLDEVLYSDIKKYVAIEDVFVCPNGISPLAILYPQNRRNEIPRILFLSNMIASKGVWTLVEACAILKKRNVAFKCDFVGKWGDVTEYDFKRAISERGLDEDVHAFGARYGEEKVGFLGQADIFAFPTYYDNECFPIVLLEAMEYGLPCISTAEGGICGIIDDGKTGYIIEKKNAVALADKIAFLIGHPDIRKEMGENGRKKFKEQFTLSIFENRMKEVLSKCLIARKES